MDDTARPDSSLPTAVAATRRDAMPTWVPRAILMFWAGYAILQISRGLLGALRTLIVTLLVSLFLSFAIEPAVNRLARRGWRRGSATGLVFLGIFLASTVFVAAIGSLVVNQVQNFIDDAPEYVQDLEDWINKQFDANVEFDELVDDLKDPKGPAQEFARDIAGNVLAIGRTALGVVFQMFTVMLFTFYLVADGPRLRRTICSVLPPERQRHVLRAWDLAIEKTGGYLYSRFILAGLSTGFTWIALTLIGVPYSLALALWVGVISQFVPVVGTYIAGGLAVLIGLIHQPAQGALTLVFITVYQQIENYLFAPRVTAQTLSLHPAVAFACVIGGAAVIGPIGALLALPAAAVVQAFISTFGDRHEVVESALTAEHVASPRARRRALRTRDARDARDTDT